MAAPDEVTVRQACMRLPKTSLSKQGIFKTKKKMMTTTTTTTMMTKLMMIREDKTTTSRRWHARRRGKVGRGVEDAEWDEGLLDVGFH